MNGLLILLQTQVAEQQSKLADKLVNPDDSVNVAIAENINKISSMSWPEIWENVSSALLKYGLRILGAILLYFVGKWLIKLLRNFLIKLFSKRKTDKSLSGFLTSVVSVTLTIILVVLVVIILGVPTSTFAALLAAGGLAVGMALSGTLQNFAGGVMILIFKPFKVGDFIEANGFSGTVDSINITSTVIHTGDNKIIILPNGSLSNGNIQNYSSSSNRRVDWTVTISYGDDVEKAKKLILEYLSKDSRVLNTPDVPFAALSSLGEDALTIVVRAWTLSSNYWGLYFDMNEMFYKELPKHDIHFPFRQLDVFIKNNQ